MTPILRVLYLLTVVAVGVWVQSLLGDSAVPGFLLANVFATPDMVMRKVARRLTNNAVFANRQNVMRDYDDQYRDRGVKMGDTITLRLPQRYEVTVGAVMNATPLTDQTVSLSITDQSNIGFEYDSWAATMEVDDYMERYGAPAVDQLVSNVDHTGLSRMVKRVAKTVGTPGTTPNANSTYTLAKTMLVEAAVPRPYRAVLTADAHGVIAGANQALFNPSAQISAFFRAGQFSGPALGIDEWFEDENIATHTVGALGGAPVVNGAGQSGTVLNITGATASVTNYWRDGDKIQVAGVYEINPETRNALPRLKWQTVVGNTSTNGAGQAAVTISPGINVTSPFQNASGTPANGAAITTFGHASNYAGLNTRMGLVWHKEAFALVMADLVLPRGLWISERISNKKLGISIRMLKDHNVVTDQSPARLDTAHGWGAIRENLAVALCLS